MAISYNIYRNNGQGGEVDYSSPIATTSLTTYAAGPLSAPSDSTFAVRVIDMGSGIEEANTDVRVRIILDRAGNDVTARPNAVVGLSAKPTAGGTCWVSWGYDPTGQGGPPLLFQVGLTVGSVASLLTPAASVAYLPGVMGYGCTLSGLAAGMPSTVAVWAVGNSAVLLGPVATASVVDLATPLGDVDSLSATATA